MKDKRVAVLLKFFQGELNPFDGAALECALDLGAKEIIAISMAPLSVKAQLENISRLNVKCVHISDDKYAGSDTQATSLVLARALEKIAPDIVFCGRQSVDGDTAQVPPMIAKRLGFDVKPKVIECENGKVVLRDGTESVISNNTVYTFEKIKTLRFPSIFSSVGNVVVLSNDDLGLSIDRVGLKGSPTRVIKSYESTVGRRFCEFVDKTGLENAIKFGLQKQRSENTETSRGEKLDEIYYVGDVKSVAKKIGKRTICLDVKNRSPEEIAVEIKAKKIKTVLWEDSEELKIFAPQVAVLTGAGICADCISFSVKEGKLVMTRPAQGGNITADIVCESDIAFATVRTVKKTGKDVVFTIGFGAVEYIDQISDLSRSFDADICASRRVVDAGIMSYSAQVGLTGKTVCPKVYVCFGLSGAVQHTCAIAGAGTVIAVNSDKNARIFDYADFGIIADIKDIL